MFIWYIAYCNGVFGEGICHLFRWWRVGSDPQLGSASHGPGLFRRTRKYAKWARDILIHVRDWLGSARKSLRLPAKAVLHAMEAAITTLNAGFIDSPSIWHHHLAQIGHENIPSGPSENRSLSSARWSMCNVTRPCCYITCKLQLRDITSITLQLHSHLYRWSRQRLHKKNVWPPSFTCSTMCRCCCFLPYKLEHKETHRGVACCVFGVLWEILWMCLFSGSDENDNAT